MPVGRLRELFAAKALKSASADPPPGAARRWPLQAPMRGASGRPSERAPSRTPPRLPAELPAEPEPSRAAPPADPPRLAAIRAAGRPRTPPVAAVWGLPLQGQAASSNQHMEFEILLSYWAHLPPHPGPISPRYSPWVSTDHFELTGHQPILLIL